MHMNIASKDNRCSFVAPWITTLIGKEIQTQCSNSRNIQNLTYLQYKKTEKVEFNLYTYVNCKPVVFSIWDWSWEYICPFHTWNTHQIVVSIKKKKKRKKKRKKEKKIKKRPPPPTSRSFKFPSSPLFYVPTPHTFRFSLPLLTTHLDHSNLAVSVGKAHSFTPLRP